MHDELEKEKDKIKNKAWTGKANIGVIHGYAMKQHLETWDKLIIHP